MRLWTIQPVEVVNILERDGVFTCDPEKVSITMIFMTHISGLPLRWTNEIFRIRMV